MESYREINGHICRSIFDIFDEQGKIKCIFKYYNTKLIDYITIDYELLCRWYNCEEISKFYIRQSYIEFTNFICEYITFFDHTNYTTLDNLINETHSKILNIFEIQYPYKLKMDSEYTKMDKIFQNDIVIRSKEILLMPDRNYSKLLMIKLEIKNNRYTLKEAYNNLSKNIIDYYGVNIIDKFEYLIDTINNDI